MRIQNTPFGSNPFKRGVAITILALFVSMELFNYAPAAFAQSIYLKVRGGNPSRDLYRLVSDSEIRIPPELGFIDESFHGTSGKTVLYIQDAHDSLEAQENIAKIINHLVAHYGVKTIFEEGYEGPVPTDKYFGFIKDPKIKEKVAYFLMDHLRVGGAEYANINRAKDFSLVGVDSLELHKESIDQYRLSALKKEAITKDLKALEKELRSLADSRFPRQLKEWLRTKEQFDAKKLDLFTYLGRLMSLLGRHGTEKCFGLIGFVLEAIRSNDPAVIEKAKHIDSREVFGELVKLEEEVSETYLHNAADKQLFKYFRVLDLLHRLNELQVSQEEYEAVKASLKAFDTESFARFIFSQAPKPVILSKIWERNIKDAVLFYEFAQERDHFLSQMLDRYSMRESKKEELTLKPAIQNSNLSILVFGGFHKETIKRILEAKGISYLVVSPHITLLSPRHTKFYKQLMTDSMYPFEKMILPVTATCPVRVFETFNGRAEVRAVYETLRANPYADLRTLDQYLAAPKRSEVRGDGQPLAEKPDEREGTPQVEGIPAWLPGNSSDPIEARQNELVNEVNLAGSVSAYGRARGFTPDRIAQISHYLRRHPEIRDRIDRGTSWMPGDTTMSRAQRHQLLISGLLAAGSLLAYEEAAGLSRGLVSGYFNNHPEVKREYDRLIFRLKFPDWFPGNPGEDPETRARKFLKALAKAGSIPRLEKKWGLTIHLIQKYLRNHPELEQNARAVLVPSWFPGKPGQTAKERSEKLSREIARLGGPTAFAEAHDLNPKNLIAYLRYHPELRRNADRLLNLAQGIPNRRSLAKFFSDPEMLAGWLKEYEAAREAMNIPRDQRDVSLIRLSACQWIFEEPERGRLALAYDRLIARRLFGSEHRLKATEERRQVQEMRDRDAEDVLKRLEGISSVPLNDLWTAFEGRLRTVETINDMRWLINFILAERAALFLWTEHGMTLVADTREPYETPYDTEKQRGIKWEWLTRKLHRWVEVASGILKEFDEMFATRYLTPDLARRLQEMHLEANRLQGQGLLGSVTIRDVRSADALLGELESFLTKFTPAQRPVNTASYGSTKDKLYALLGKLSKFDKNTRFLEETRPKRKTTGNVSPDVLARNLALSVRFQRSVAGYCATHRKLRDVPADSTYDTAVRDALQGYEIRRLQERTPELIRRIQTALEKTTLESRVQKRLTEMDLSNVRSGEKEERSEVREDLAESGPRIVPKAKHSEHDAYKSSKRIGGARAVAIERDPRGRKAIIPHLLKEYQNLLEGMTFAEAARFMTWITPDGQAHRLTRAALSLYFKTHPEAFDNTGLFPKSWQRVSTKHKKSDTPLAGQQQPSAVPKARSAMRKAVVTEQTPAAISAPMPSAKKPESVMSARSELRARVAALEPVFPTARIEMRGTQTSATNGARSLAQGTKQTAFKVMRQFENPKGDNRLATDFHFRTFVIKAATLERIPVSARIIPIEDAPYFYEGLPYVIPQKRKQIDDGIAVLEFISKDSAKTVEGHFIFSVVSSLDHPFLEIRNVRAQEDNQRGFGVDRNFKYVGMRLIQLAASLSQSDSRTRGAIGFKSRKGDLAAEQFYDALQPFGLQKQPRENGIEWSLNPQDAAGFIQAIDLLVGNKGSKKVQRLKQPVQITSRSEVRTFESTDKDPYWGIARQWAAEGKGKTSIPVLNDDAFDFEFHIEATADPVHYGNKVFLTVFHQGHEVGYLHARFYPRKTTSHASLDYKTGAGQGLAKEHPEALFVHPDIRQQYRGVGRALMGFLMRLSQIQGHEEIVLYGVQDEKFFEDLGFEKFDETRVRTSDGSEKMIKDYKLRIEHAGSLFPDMKISKRSEVKENEQPVRIEPASQEMISEFSGFWRTGAMASFGNGYDKGIEDLWRNFFSSLPTTARVLDIGSGPATLPHLGLLISDQFHFDLIEPAAVPRDRTRLRQFDFHQIPAEEMNFADGTFDAAVSMFGLEYSSIEVPLGRLFKALKPGASALFVLHHPESYIIRRLKAMTDRSSGWLEHRAQLISGNPEKVMSLLVNQNHPFDVVEGPEKLFDRTGLLGWVVKLKKPEGSRSEIRKAAVEMPQADIPIRMPSTITPSQGTGVRSWMDATLPEKMYVAMSAATLERLGEKKEDGKQDRLWKELLAVKAIYAEKFEMVITGNLTIKAEGRVKELENFGKKVFIGSAALHLPKDAKVVYFTFEGRDEASLPVPLRQQIRAAFHELREGDFLSAVQLSLSSYLDQDLSRILNIRRFIADRLGFNAAQAIETLFTSWVIISAAA